MSEYTTKAGGSAANTIKGLASGFGVRCQLVRLLLHGDVRGDPLSASHQDIGACTAALLDSLSGLPLSATNVPESDDVSSRRESVV